VARPSARSDPVAQPDLHRGREVRQATPPDGFAWIEFVGHRQIVAGPRMPVNRPALNGAGKADTGRRYAALTGAGLGCLSTQSKGVDMPAKTEKQRKFMGAELQRKREGKETQTDMSEKELEKYASKDKKSS
jgi:hypothetical protein